MDSQEQKIALISGISGQDGGFLAKLLLQKGYRVFGTSRDAQISGFRNLDRLGIRQEVTLLSMEIRDFRSVLQVLEKTRPDEIYNLAGQSSVGLSFDQPVETFESISVAVLNLLEATRFLSRPVRLYTAGSSECFGDTGGEPADENTPFRPRSPYAVAKAAAFWESANYREAYGVYACTGILFNHESFLRPEGFVTRKIVSAACRIAGGSKEKLYLGNMNVARDWGWAPEYVEAMWLMLQQPEPEDYVIATGQTHLLSEFVAEAFSRLKLDWREHVECNPELMRPTDIMVSAANPLKAARKLGWRAGYAMPDVVQLMVDGC
ncbi:MAG: GDP-mannose 4,6-dehydratase [Pseudomonadota bacterium]